MRTVFYSWQSDLPNATNRGFIEDCLERALEDLHVLDVRSDCRRELDRAGSGADHGHP